MGISIKAITNPIKKVGDFIDDKITQPVFSGVGDKLNQVADFVAPFVENYTVAGIALGWLRKRLAPDADTAPTTLNTRGRTQAAIPLIYGEIKTGGQFVTLQVRDSSRILGGAFVLCSGEINSVTNIVIDNKAINHADYDSGAIFSYTIHPGSVGQTADANLQLFPSYTAAFTFNEIAYISSINTFKRDGGPKGIPRIEATVQGKLLYDTRTSLIAYSNNPALCALDFLINQTYGYGFLLADINAASISASANLCDTLIPATARRLFVLNAKFLPAREDQDATLDAILSSFRATIKLDGAGLIEFSSDIDTLPTFTFDESNVISHSITRSPSKDVFNAAEIRWVDAAGERDVAYYSNATFLTEDSNIEKVVKLQLKTDNDYDRAMDLGEFVVRQSRQGLLIQAQCHLTAFETTVHDVVNVTLTEYGFTNKLFRVTELSLSEDLIVEVTLAEHDPTAYLYTSHPANYTPPIVSLPDERDITAVQTLTVTPQTFFGQFSESIGQLHIQWTAPTLGLVDTYEVEYKLNGDPTWIASGVTAATDWLISNVAVGSWDVRVRAINISRYSSPWVEVLGTGYVAPVGDNNPVPLITGLGLKYGGATFKGRSAIWTWDEMPVAG